MALLDHLGIDEAVFMGMSQGGYLSMRAALRHPDRVGRWLQHSGDCPRLVTHERCAWCVDHVYGEDRGQMIIRKNITLTEQQERWVKAQIASGDYANESEYIRDLIRRDQRERARVAALQTAIDEGIASGVYDGDAQQVIAGVRSRLGLPRSDG